MDLRTEFRIGYDRHLETCGNAYTALYEAIREAILQGQLTYGTRLPSSRQLASSYGISRGTVNTAYEMLLSEGYIRAETGRGTFVDFQSASAFGQKEHAATIFLSPWVSQLDPVPDRGGSGRELRKPPADLTIGRVDPRLFPIEEWKTAYYAEVRSSAERPYESAFTTEGYVPLREAIALYLARERGVLAEPEQIVITNGSMHAIAILSMLLIHEGDDVVVENPSYGGIRRAVKAAGGRVLNAAVDREGIIPDQWQSRLLFVTPTRQFPTGVALSLKRKTALLKWAVSQDAVIIEDDYDSEFRWGERPTEPLKALDQTGRVVYIGTFSKTMLTDLRIGYAVLPSPLVDPFRRAKYLFEPYPTGIVEQRALSGFMASGRYGKHLRRMKRECGRRMIVFRNHIQPLLNRHFEFYDSDAGLHLYARWRGASCDYDHFRQECEKAGIVWTDGNRYELPNTEQRYALFGFVHMNEQELMEAAAIIESVIEHR
ncbi:MocR-like pyridoxine biosynthesis transcription factor PdxR [Paenibacillus abyssi]|uniref:GntR family transcriptional regulator n=1 Tax=Paenibacillus abyssi TaxID=1340531 RepID=A0A917CVE4_9BACL|nr:PLP-dependent aminotransferase family protein [Paenibacillus abyssi]GGF98915.1 GntR family transcriptional regulator [Paenibacillus abyssi]